MIRRIGFVTFMALLCAGCGSGPTPSVSGRDSVGLPVYSVDGGRLPDLEAVANSNCPGITRPYVKAVSGSGEDSSLTYTCE